MGKIYEFSSKKFDSNIGFYFFFKICPRRYRTGFWLFFDFFWIFWKFGSICTTLVPDAIRLRPFFLNDFFEWDFFGTNFRPHFFSRGGSFFQKNRKFKKWVSGSILPKNWFISIFRLTWAWGLKPGATPRVLSPIPFFSGGVKKSKFRLIRKFFPFSEILSF